VEVPESALGAGGRRTKATDEWEAEALAANPDAIILKADEAWAYRAQFNAILENPVYGALSADTIAREFSIRWRDASGLQLKCRPDAATHDVLWDVQTTREVQPRESFWKSVVDFGYGFQAVLRGGRDGTWSAVADLAPTAGELGFEGLQRCRAALVAGG
jgi:hypothetical protein